MDKASEPYSDDLNVPKPAAKEELLDSDLIRVQIAGERSATF